jgi:hypothetical protein
MSLTLLDTVALVETWNWRVRVAHKARLPIDCRLALRSKWVAQELLYWCTYHEPRFAYYIVLRHLILDVVARTESSGERVVRLLYHWEDFEQHVQNRSMRRETSDTLINAHAAEGGRLRASLAFAREGGPRHGEVFTA